MSGLTDNVSVIGDWIPFSHNDEQGQFSGSKEMLSMNHSDNRDTGQVDDRSNQFTELGSFSDYKLNSRGGLVERMAARAGYNAPRLNTEGIRPNDVLNSDSRSSPLLMISPGLSPTSLLDSPVFLSNSLAQPSPTTGKFPLFPTNGSNSHRSTLGGPTDTNTCRGYLSKDIGSASFAFKPSSESSPSFFGCGSKRNEPMCPQQSLSFPRIDNSSQSENSISLQPHSNCESTKMQPPRMFESIPEHGSDEEEGGDQKGNGDSVGGGTPSEDGYNWRKYGQKQVKGSEFPRSYYKCTHNNCPVKKKVERSHEGHITEIIYKGAHNHPKPPPNRRAAIGGPDGSETIEAGCDGEAGWNNVNRSSGSEWKQDNFEVTSTPAERVNYGHQDGSGLEVQNGSGQFEGGGAEAVDASSTFSNEEVEDDPGTNGSVSLGYDAEGDELESKRRKIEVYPSDMSGATRAIREPRVVVQTTSEVDILDDGYRWRKYGQKVVKGNPNPRSYYKCTSPGCSVRKHVERASHDLKSVITTYEGKHNHDVPAARSSSHGNSGASGSAHAHRPDPSMVHNVMPRFDGSGPVPHFGLPGRPLHLGHGVSFGMGGPNIANFGLNPVHGKMPMHPFLTQQRQLSEMGFMMPKGDAKVEPDSVYQQLMSRLPLGPHM